MAASKKIASDAVAPPLVLATPDYWAEACKHLVKKDRVMKRLIPQFGDAALQTKGDPFITLARSIVGQQVSVASAQAVWERFVALLPRGLKPASVLKLKIDDMRAAGLSARKVDYLVDLAMHFEGGKLHVKNAKWALDDAPIDADCACEVCARHSRGYIRHLFQVGEPTGSRLVSIHNVAWTMQLMQRMRDAIAAGTFGELRRQVLAVWG